MPLIKHIRSTRRGMLPRALPRFPVVMHLSVQTELSTSKRGRGDLLASGVFPQLTVAPRHLNIDYALASTLANDVDVGIKDVVVTYDVACQWSKNLSSRLKTYSSIPPLNLNALESFRTAVPKFHLIGHGPPCQSRFNLAFMDGVGMTHGEGVETIWSHSTSLATWSRENGPAARRLILDNHWTGWNWSKLVGLREYFPLVRNLCIYSPAQRPSAEENVRKSMEVGCYSARGGEFTELYLVRVRPWLEEDVDRIQEGQFEAQPL